MARSLDARDTASGATATGWGASRAVADGSAAEESAAPSSWRHGCTGSRGSGPASSSRSPRSAGWAASSAHAHPATGRPLPIAAQIVEAVNTYDILLTGSSGERVGRREAIERMSLGRAAVGPDVLRALAAVVGAGRGARHRRGEDVLQDARDVA